MNNEIKLVSGAMVMLALATMETAATLVLELEAERGIRAALAARHLG